MGLAGQWQEVEDGRPNVVGRLERLRRRAEPDVQRPHGHLVLRARAGSARRAGLPAAGVRADGRICGLGISNMKGALACYVEAVRALAGRRRAPAGRRRDRRGRPARSRRRSGARSSGRRVPRLRRRLAATSSPTAASPTCASSASRPSRSSCSGTSARCGCGSRPAALHPHRLQRGQARPELDRAHARGRSTRCSSGSRPGRAIRRTRIAARPRSSTSARSRAASGGASRGRRTAPTSSSTSACRRRRR